MAIIIREEFLAETIETVYEAFAKAEHHKLQYEVLASAFIHLKNNPTWSIEDALEAGLSDWDV